MLPICPLNLTIFYSFSPRIFRYFSISSSFFPNFFLCLSLSFSLIALTVYSTHSIPTRKVPNSLSTHIPMPYPCPFSPFLLFYTYRLYICIISPFFSPLFSKQILLLPFNSSPMYLTAISSLTLTMFSYFLCLSLSKTYALSS